MMAVEDVIVRIKAAFDGMKYPGDGKIFEKFMYETVGYRPSDFRVFLGKKWEEVEYEDIWDSHPANLSFEGRIYYCPVILLACLSGFWTNEVGAYLKQNIYDNVWGYDKAWGPIVLEERRRAFRESLSSKQACAVVRFMEYRAVSADCDERALSTLKGGWRAIWESCGPMIEPVIDDGSLSGTAHKLPDV